MTGAMTEEELRATLHDAIAHLEAAQGKFMLLDGCSPPGHVSDLAGDLVPELEEMIGDTRKVRDLQAPALRVVP